ncbi:MULTISPECIES: ABC-2 transporter permease [Bacillus cereus group]|uniref:ABC-2 transporter permease n=1 Tax=Bacillus cereus group TaxID=86661 RepID=UPI000B4439A9|nr:MULTISPECIES: ABC-2 transporter permease [Bacillus cereus group]MDC6157388.1 ABC-2 transporter permease [Bacillus albus]MDD8006865.1 ABC-2 transporter permease [Bacillus albus]MED3026393.1 ABC-2 transporter permease [Bacillus wiedmannii]OTY00791.1 ABC transporter permease [Bacillus thuringiensis serovar wratislaviensis]OUB55492.1 ABC transporter permease [Bacillus thuringiensis serovar sylvestriensis]
MLINLVMKDFLLVKKYFLILLVFAAIAPIYLSSQLQLNDGGLVSFLLTVILMEYILFGTVSKFEDQYKGAALLCATPYTRSAFVKAKYLFLFVIFICAAIIRIIISVVAPSGIESLSASALGITFLTLSILFGVLLPVQFKFGYDKTKIISLLTAFLIPFVAPTLIRGLQSSNIDFKSIFPFSPTVLTWMPCFISIIIGFISMIISLKVYAKKDL